MSTEAKADPVRAQAWAKLEREWAIDGMPADKIRLARAAFDAGAALTQQAGAEAVSLAESLCAYMRDEDKRLPADVFKLPAPMQTALVTLRGLADAPMRIHPRDASEAVDYIVAHALAPQPTIPEGAVLAEEILRRLVEQRYLGTEGAMYRELRTLIDSQHNREGV